MVQLTPEELKFVEFARLGVFLAWSKMIESQTPTPSGTFPPPAPKYQGSWPSDDPIRLRFPFWPDLTKEEEDVMCLMGYVDEVLGEKVVEALPFKYRVGVQHLRMVDSKIHFKRVDKLGDKAIETEEKALASLMESLEKLPSDCTVQPEPCTLCPKTGYLGDPSAKGPEVSLPCEHSFHRDCLREWLCASATDGPTLRCPSCDSLYPSPSRFAALRNSAFNALKMYERYGGDREWSEAHVEFQRQAVGFDIYRRADPAKVEASRGKK